MGVAKLGPLSPDRCFCLKVPAILGGPYTEDNIGATFADVELIPFSGDLCKATQRCSGRYSICDENQGEVITCPTCVASNVTI